MNRISKTQAAKILRVDIENDIDGLEWNESDIAIEPKQSKASSISQHRNREIIGFLSINDKDIEKPVYADDKIESLIVEAEH